MNHRELLDIAISNLNNSYSPYSNCKVSAALLCSNGRVYKGVNVENASFGATNCAERSAIYNAISNADREFEAIAIATSLDNPIMPCGICRQVMLEFAPDMEVIVGDKKEYKLYKAKDLLSGAFTPNDLRGCNE